ncbi:hypothetical protein NLJ89_g1043 [Agrocybe chaxingu]|uniref:Nephrocystin 3-like N-terminal domain-containing protein n=1 Tax=Agrocybe chaxingu TaxID=84603 RepID=A0A9W8TF32_9AGAR|nr:hypothetical protein NLJ89_g1043 [Agrocybe chaxingu]
MKAVAPNAFHNSDDRPDPPKCHEKTRIAVISKIMDWITGKVDADALMLWLYGPAGVGKSAIARTIAELCEPRKLLLASFFFFRSNSTRNTTKPLVANIAYRIACVIPAARRHIEMAIEADPLLLSCSLETQFAKLVVGPLQALAEQGMFSQTPLPPLILIDGLDECLDRTSQMKLIQLLSSCQLPLKFLIASRPEQDIKFAFASISTKVIVSHLELNDDFNAYEDIRLFLTDKLSNIKQHHPFRGELPAPWPREGQIASLVQKSCGQFIYASLVARFVDSPRHLPAQRLDIVLGIRPPVHRDLPFAELDALYTFILSSSIDPLLTVKVLGVRHVLQQDFSMVRELRDIVRMIEGILGLESGDVRSALSDLSSLVEIKDNMATLERNAIFFQHSSFQDFLLNKERSKEYSIDVLECHRVSVQWVLRAFPRAGPRASHIMPDAVDLHVHLLKLPLTAELKHDLENFSFHDYLETQLERLEKAGQTANLNLIRDRLTKDFFGTLTYLCQSSEFHDHHFNLFIDDITASVNRHPSAEKFHLLSTIWFVLQKPLKSYPSTELSVKIARQIFELHRAPLPFVTPSGLSIGSKILS